jgi:hypothetical protein
MSAPNPNGAFVALVSLGGHALHWLRVVDAHPPRPQSEVTAATQALKDAIRAWKETSK